MIDEAEQNSMKTPMKDDVILQHIFQIRLFHEQTFEALVSLFYDTITVKPINNKIDKFKLEFDFDTVFSVLKFNQTEEEIKTHSGVPFGIKIEKFQESIQFHNRKSPEIIQLWHKHLSKALNQKNFHETFKPIKKIGKGNFATVYLVVKHEDQRSYAVKAFSKQYEFEDEKGKETLENEIKIIRSLNHENLMKMEGVYETDNSIYMCMEYLSGDSLYNKIKKRTKFTAEQIKTIMRCLLEGVESMHRNGIMHRDLKPENIIFRDEESFDCVIADFGLATFVNAQKYIYTRCGTPGYVAPQISNLKDSNSRYDAICDIFSLGVIFHILVLEKPPFPGKQCDQVLKQNRNCNINFQQEIYRKLPSQWLCLLKRMLEKDPKKRISAIEALNHDFFHESNLMIPEELELSRSTYECDSPLMITKNSKRKRNIRLRDDSCIKFKMVENLELDSNEGEQNVERINSPCIKKRNSPRRKQKKSKTLQASNFKS